MRINAIRGENLASLARPFAIELVDGPLGGAGLFAITGPVGAGKSTLLDAMCLALFDRTPRLSGRGGVPIGDDLAGRDHWLRANDPRTLLRRDAVAAWAEVDFSGRDGRLYRSRWSIRRARHRHDGRVLEQEMVLRQLPGGDVVAAGRRREVLDAIQERLGLDFDQFCRSVLLAQGEFHGFLFASVDQRARLLETLTGASIYRRLSQAAHERCRAGAERLRALAERRVHLVVLVDAERRALEQRAKALADELATCELGVALAQRYVTWHEALDQLQRSESEATLSLHEAQAADRDAEPRRAALARRRRALDAVPRFEVAEEAGAAARAAAAEAQAAEAKVARALQAVAAQRAALTARLAAAFGVAVAEPPPLVADLRQWRPLVERLGRAEQQVETAARELAAAEAACAAAREAVDELAVGGERLRRQEQEAEAAAASARAAARAIDRDDLARRRAALQREWDAWRARQRAAEDWDRTAQEAAARRAAFADAAHRLERCRADCAAAQIEFDRAEAGWGAACDALASLERRHGLQALRAALVDGEPCPLCGAREHPLPAAPVMDLDAQRQLHSAAEREFAAARQRRDVATAALKTAEEFAAVRRTEHEAAAAAATAAAAAFATAALVPGSQTAQAAVQAVQAERQRLEAATAAVDRAEQQAVAATRAADGAADAQRTAAQRVREHQHAAVAAATRLQAAELELQRCRAAIEAGERALAEYQTELDAACAGLPGRHRALAALGDRLAVLDALHAASAAVVAAAAQAKRDQDEAERAAARRAECDARAGRAARDLERELAAREVTAADVAAAREAGTADLEATAAALAGLADAVKHWRAVLSERVARRRDHERHQRPSLDAEEARRALEEARRATDRIRQQKEDAAVKLRCDDDQRRLAAELLPQLETAERELSVWQALDELIGSSSGDAFAVFAQGVTLEILLVEANHRLEELARRYQLERSAGGDLDIVVVDHDLGGQRRALRSLSGGETFLVSLALALALATLAAPRSRVETLFLDEGFGTLDAQSLETALAALDSLQAGGCQVGIISHVDGIAERIGAVVEVRPEGGGRSAVIGPHAAA